MANLLFIDDESQMLELFAKLFSQGNQIFTALGSSAAYEILHREMIEIVFIDILLEQKQNVFEIADLIHADFPKLRIYFMTGLDKRSISQRPDCHYQVLNKSELVLNADDENFIRTLTAVS